MGNACAPCAQECSSMFKDKSGEATFDLDSEHAPALSHVNQVQVVPNGLPRVGLGPPVRDPSFGTKLSGSRETGKPEDQVPQLSGKLISREPSHVTTKRTSEDLISSRRCAEASSDADARATILSSATEGSFAEEASEKAHDPEVSTELGIQSASEPALEAAIEQVGESAQQSLPSLELIFEIDGEDKRVLLHRRPLGAEFMKRVNGPTKISKIHPNSYASELGMQKGWIIKFVGSEDVSSKTYE